MSYAQNWVENQPTTATLANTIWQYWQNNQIAIRERLDGLFGTMTWATSANYQAASFDMRGSATPRIFGGSTDWGITNNAATFDNFIVDDTGNVSFRGNTLTGGGSGFTIVNPVTFNDNVGFTSPLTVNNLFTVNGASAFNGSAVMDLGQASVTEVALGNVTGATTIDWSTGNNQSMTLTGNASLTFTNPANAGFYFLRITQGGGAGNLITWPSSTRWSSAVQPTLTLTIGKVDFISFYYDGTFYNGFFSGFNY